MNHPGKVFLTLTAALLLLCPQIFAQEPSGEAAPPPAEQTDQDEDTKLICLVSMLADREIMEEVLCEADQLHKPVVAVFLAVPYWKGKYFSKPVKKAKEDAKNA